MPVLHSQKVKIIPKESEQGTVLTTSHYRYAS